MPAENRIAELMPPCTHPLRRYELLFEAYNQVAKALSGLREPSYLFLCRCEAANHLNARRLYFAAEAQEVIESNKHQYSALGGYFTMRYLILRGQPRNEENYHRFGTEGETLHVPEWYLRRCRLLE